MKDNNIKTLVKSMQAALKRDHGMEVPYSALRASYLVAQGLNPHAQGKTAAVAVTAASAAPPAPVEGTSKPGWVTKTLHLAMAEDGILQLVSLDAEGEFLCLPRGGFKRGEALLQHIKASVPSMKRYGLPDFLQDQAGWFREHFGLELAPGSTFDIEDLGDDSGESASLTLSLTESEWARVVLAALEHRPGLREGVAEWVGLHYGQTFASVERKQAEWVERFVEAHAGEDASAWLPADRTIATDDGTFDRVMLEWVWPDEDSGSVYCSVDSATGLITPAAGETVHPEAQHLDRVRVDVEAEALEEGFLQFDAYLDESVSPAVWRLTSEGLQDLQAALMKAELIKPR